MRSTHIEHIGIAVENLREAISKYEKILGLSCYAIEEVPDQKVRTAFFKIGEIKIELLESTSPDGPIAKFIEKKGPGLHHIAFAIDDLQKNLKELQEEGVSLIDKIPRKGADQLRIAFVHPRELGGVLAELCEQEELILPY